MNNQIRQIKGITLIALVITIIVLLILAGVTVATLTGDNGLLTKTSEAQFRTEIAQYKEELNLSIINDQAETKGNRTDKFNETEYSKIKELIPSFNRKYENSLVIEEDKLVYKGNDKELYRKALEIGLIPEDELLDDEMLEELQPFITEWTVGDNDTITLPIGGTCDFTVNYGDGTEYKVTSSTDEDRIHTYATAGTYTVTIKGKCGQFSFWNTNISKDKITKILQWGKIEAEIIDFASCANLSGSIPTPSKNSFNKIRIFYPLFFRCSNLEGNIPKNLFKNCKNVENFSACFVGCSKLTGIIPEELFKDCEKASNFSYCFQECTNLKGSIPEKLFTNNLKAKNFTKTFYGCKGLTGSIPEKLFANCVNVTSFEFTFLECENISGYIPEELFKNCISVTNCHGTFWNCFNLNGSISERLFENCTNISNFNGTFHGCNKLTGNAPALWIRTNVTNSSECFKNCTNLSNYSDIPSDWK